MINPFFYEKVIYHFKYLNAYQKKIVIFMGKEENIFIKIR